MSEAYIVSALRTAGGRKNGRLKDWHPVDLAGHMLAEIVSRTGVEPTDIDDVIMGCVSQAGEQSNNIARYAVLASGLPNVISATTIDRQCGSGQQAVHFAAQAVISGSMDIVIAGGVESMTRVPMGTPVTAAANAGLGGPFSPALQARFGQRFNQFTGAEIVARKHGLTKDDIDQFSLDSHIKAAAAIKSGAFSEEIVPLAIEGDQSARHATDEGVRWDATLESIRAVKPILEGGLLSAANASQICDGASVMMIVNERGLKKLNCRPIARIHHMTVMGGDPVVNLEVPLAATEKALARSGMKIGDIDLFEVNEAFAPIPLAWLKSTGADPVRLNTLGGAIALGHPLGASGTKLMATLVHALKTGGKRWGLQTMCEGGGQANVTILESL